MEAVQARLGGDLGQALRRDARHRAQCQHLAGLGIATEPVARRHGERFAAARRVIERIP